MKIKFIFLILDFPSYSKQQTEGKAFNTFYFMRCHWFFLEIIQVIISWLYNRSIFASVTKKKKEKIN